VAEHAKEERLRDEGTILLLAVHLRLDSDRPRSKNGSEGLKTRKKQSWAAAWGVVACWLIVCDGNAWAQGPGPVKPAPAQPATAQAGPNPQEAERRYDAGLQFVQGDKWAEAREEFRKAYAAAAQPKYLAALIKAEIATGQHANAAGHLVALLRMKSELDANTLAQAEEKLAELRKQLGAATIKVNVEGAEVLVDGVVVGTSPLKEEVFVGSGRRTFQARREGFVTAEESVEVAAGSKPMVALGLKKDEGPALGAGSEKGGGSRKTWLYAGAAVSGGLAAVALGTFIGAEALYGPAEDKLDGKCNGDCRTEFESLTSTQQALAYTSFITIIGAGVVGGATLACWLTGKKSDDTDKGPRGAFVVTPGVGSVIVSGRW
jgi:hypothetical protein